MELQFENQIKRKKNPVKRNNKFFSGYDVSLELEFAKEYLEQDANQTVILYQVDLDKTNVNNTYVEAKKDAIRFKQPVEVPCVYEIQDAEMKNYGGNTQKAMYAKTGKLTFSVLISTLEEIGCDINRGDYVGVQIDTEHIEYFTVTDDGRVMTTSNKYTMYGTMPYARKIECAPIDANEFNG